MKPLEAHLQLMQRLPVRTISARTPRDYHCTRPPTAVTLALNARIVALHGAGRTNKEIAALVRCSKATVSRHLNDHVSVVKAAKEPQ